MTRQTSFDSTGASRPEFPDMSRLRAGFSSALRGAGYLGPVTILNREEHHYVSTYPSEVVTCQLDAGPALRILCKYSADRQHAAHGHRGGIQYEAQVYRSILRPLEISTPRYFGTYDDPATGWTWLLIEYLDQTQRVSRVENGVEQAAQWLGRFHAMNEPRLLTSYCRFLTRYDAAYYRSWIDRTIRLLSLPNEGFPELPALVRRSDETIQTLCAAPATTIHGEYYVANILMRAGVVYPIDWESAAIGAGEIDLASLSAGWDEATVQACEEAYAQARWPWGAPDSFPSALRASRIYFVFRWLGDVPTWSIESRSRWYQQELSRERTRWGLT